MALSGAARSEGGPVETLLATSRDWFASALQAVLEPEGFTFKHVRSGEEAFQETVRTRPDLVIIDEGLADTTASELCRRLVEGPLERGVPLLVYSPNFWHESEQTEAMRAGAWDIIREPIRSRLLVAKLERLLGIRRLIEASEREHLADPQMGLFTVAGLMRTLPILGSLAERAEVPMSCAVLGPTRPASDEALDRQRRDTSTLCVRHTRTSDLRGWIDEADIALVVYDADVPEATQIVRRLSGRTGDAAEAEHPDLSAGVVELPPEQLVAEARRGVEERPPAGGASMAHRFAPLAHFAAAQDALRRAREAGGGIRVAEAP